MNNKLITQHINDGQNPFLLGGKKCCQNIKIGGVNHMDKKISVRLREEEYEKISQNAKKTNKSVSEYMRNRALTEAGQKEVRGTSEVRIQLLNIKKYLSELSSIYTSMNSKPIDDAMEVIWDELY